ncbi:hypothetical protein QTP86_000641 [Hemibagrus guttatus]|nr:hypothetical protein QTP86_000641 [Hemibagrus guttatus]
MMSQGVQFIGILTAFLGWLGVIVACGLPQWRVSAFIGANIVTAQIIWEGIWMTCVVQSTGQMQCKIYDSMLALSADLQAARAMIIISILAGVIGIMASIAGGKCTNCIENSRAKATGMHHGWSVFYNRRCALFDPCILDSSERHRRIL